MKVIERTIKQYFEMIPMIIIGINTNSRIKNEGIRYTLILETDHSCANYEKYKKRFSNTEIPIEHNLGKTLNVYKIWNPGEEGNYKRYTEKEFLELEGKITHV